MLYATLLMTKLAHAVFRSAGDLYEAPATAAEPTATFMQNLGQTPTGTVAIIAFGLLALTICLMLGIHQGIFIARINGHKLKHLSPTDHYALRQFYLTPLILGLAFAIGGTFGAIFVAIS